MAKAATIVPSERIASRILFIRAHRVMLDSDLAEVYGTTTKALNQAVKRNRGRFPSDFMFPLTRREKSEVVTNCDHLRKLKYSARLPFAFTEHGAIMIASVLKQLHCRSSKYCRGPRFHPLAPIFGYAQGTG